MNARTISKSLKLDDVCYDIRGPILEQARRLEEDGHRILKLNIGNPAPFGFDAPQEIVRDVIHNLPAAQGYSDSQGIYSSRKAIMQYCQQLAIDDVQIEDIYIGNGVSELIVIAMQALLNNGDEMLIPAPDYPLWTAAVTLAGAQPVHYLCDENNGWLPDPDDIESRINEHTRGIVIINPNNPTGAVYPQDLLMRLADIARRHDLPIFSDEIYDKILYDGLTHTAIASLADDLLFVTFNGLSKTYRAAGFRAGWMVVSGMKSRARDYIEGLDILTSMRLCSNVPAQYAIQTALGGYQSVQELVAPQGRWTRQRDLAWEMLNEIPGVSCNRPGGALYLFPRLDPHRYPVACDEQLVLELLREEHILLVQGSAFNWPDQNHLRLVFLPRVEDLQPALERLHQFLMRRIQD